MSANPIFFAHANGFPASSYQHFWQYLTPHPVLYEEVLSPGVKPIRRSWREVVPQLIQSIEKQASGPVIGLGHSFGSVLTWMAAQERPDLFQQIIIMEPPFLPPSWRLIIGLLRLTGFAERLMPLAKQALNRKDHFVDRDEAAAYWGSKKFFQAFEPRCFDDYLKHGLREDKEGGYTLTIPKVKEANIFLNAPRRFGDTKVSMPAHYIYASRGNTLPEANVKAQQKRFPSFQFHRWEGGHMFPLEAPEAAAKKVLSLIGEG